MVTSHFPAAKPDQNLSHKRCRLRWSTQHWLAVYSREFRSLRFFWGVDSSAVRPGRVALANGPTGRFLAGSIAATGDSCFRWCRVARDFADHRSRPAHPSLLPPRGNNTERMELGGLSK